MNTDSVAFYFQILHLLCADAVTLVSFPHLLNILYLMLLFILTTYVCCSNSKLNTYDHVFNCLQNNQWGGFKKPMTRSPPLFSYPFLFSFLFLRICHFSQGTELLEKTRLLFIYERPLFLYLSLERKSQMCVFFKEHWINLHNLQSCLPASCLSDMPVCTPNVCPLSIETLIFCIPRPVEVCLRMQFVLSQLWHRISFPLCAH